MKRSTVVLALMQGALAFAAVRKDVSTVAVVLDDQGRVDSVLACYGRSDAAQEAALLAELASWKAKASADSAMLAVLKAGTPSGFDTSWGDQVPDSVKSAFAAKQERIALLRDSLRAVLAGQGDALKARFDSLGVDARIRRDAFLSQLDGTERARIQAKVDALDKEQERRRAVLAKGVAEEMARRQGR